MSSKKRLKKIEENVAFWKGYASGFASAIACVAGLICLINYLIQIGQAVR